MELQELLSKLKFDKDGLIPAIAQDINTGAVVMLAFMNEEAVRRTYETRNATYFSRSRNQLWVKGEMSGNTQKVVEILFDCDADAILLKLEQTGAACHTGNYSCFYNTVFNEHNTSLQGAAAITQDYNTIMDRVKNPLPGSYTNYLFEKGIDKMCKKVGEEASEVIIAAKNDSPEELTSEAADLIYHLLVVMAKIGVTPERLYAAIEQRR